MTTTVTVKTHNWEVDVELQPFHATTGQPFVKTIRRVPRHVVREFYIHSGQDLFITEVPNPPE